MKLLFIFFVFILASCKDLGNLYTITRYGVYSKYHKISHFSISQFKLEYLDKNDIRPKNHVELMRYCCDIKPSLNKLKKVLFRDTSNYFWEYCKLDTSFVTNNSLSFKQKIDLIKLHEQQNNDLDLIKYKLPFQIEKGFVYQIFGLPDLDGSFYFCIDSSNKFIVQYQDAGPF